MNIERRKFVKRSVTASVGISLAAPYISLMGKNAPSDAVRVGIIGANGRGNFHAEAFSTVAGVEVSYICDVDERAVAKGQKTVKDVTGKTPQGITDLRKMVEIKDLDAVVIATPDHWHTPAAIIALTAGKEVYVEKPCSHNPGEGEMLVEATKKYNRIVQMGNQRRSHPIYIRAIRELHDGVIGRVYFARGWYANNRESIGTGKVTAVPSWLQYDLWQGPAPRVPYRDNVIHYNWHWFWRWGTTETCNNGTHEIDVMRWGMDEQYPAKVSSSGGRYHYQDDWEVPDTQVLTFDFEDKRSFIWEGRSCNGLNEDGESRGVIFYGENGAMKIYNTAYTILDRHNKKVREEKEPDEAGRDMTNTVGPGMRFDIHHINNFINTIRGREKLNSPIESGYLSTLYPLLGNIAYRTGRILNIDQRNGHILNDPAAMEYWRRQYEPGWSPVI